jgi:hypothetical protein
MTIPTSHFSLSPDAEIEFVPDGHMPNADRWDSYVTFDVDIDRWLLHHPWGEVMDNPFVLPFLTGPDVDIEVALRIATKYYDLADGCDLDREERLADEMFVDEDLAAWENEMGEGEL